MTDSLRAGTSEGDSRKTRQALRMQADVIMGDKASLTLETLEAWSPEETLRLQRFDGSEIFVINSASPVGDIRGNIAGSAAAIQDITELKRAGQALHGREGFGPRPGGGKDRRLAPRYSTECPHLVRSNLSYLGGRPGQMGPGKGVS
jgi:hypothetical protein